jgi:hypothetical protein
MQQQLNTGLVFVDDYRPGVPFQVVSRMQQTTVNDILGTEVNGPVVTDPTDYNGYIYTYQGCGGGNYGLAFVREGNIQQDQTYSFSADATFFSNDIQLLEAGMQQGGGGGAAGGNVTGGDDVTDDTNVTGEDNVTDGNQTDGNVTGDNVTDGNQTGGNQSGDLNVSINDSDNQTGG